MFYSLVLLFKMALYLAHSRKQLVINIAIFQKEVEILKRKKHKKRLRIKYSDRVIGSIRREVLDYFILLTEKQILNILQEYVAYYNSKRPHQGLG